MASTLNSLVGRLGAARNDDGTCGLNYYAMTLKFSAKQRETHERYCGISEIMQPIATFVAVISRLKQLGNGIRARGLTLRERPLEFGFMKAVLSFAVAGLALALLITTADAKGCAKGAAAGGVAGHHAVAGAVAGCVIGHHEAKKKQESQTR